LPPNKALPHLIDNGKGSIVNFSSIYGLVGNDEFTAYHVSKGDVTMQTKQNAATLSGHARCFLSMPGQPKW
jgi:NAD(P)-dependent dehydrogenase (short-subunit alcohol dehydrogenase family)